MSRPPTVVLFGRAPRWGSGKRRLAARIGAGEALRFQRAQWGRLVRALGQDDRWRVVLAVTPDGARGPWRGGHPVIAQGWGDLGARMRRTLATGGPGPVVLIGTDLPDLRAAHVAQAFRLLRGADVVFGPAADGGFWLVGLSGRRPLSGLFAGVGWSRPTTLADTLAGIDRRRRVALADTLADVDA